MSKSTGLGQGVGLLFGDDEEKFFECDIDKIVPNKFQPRTHFDEESLEELAQSISEKGIIQPLVVTVGEGNKYELIAGERRLRASKIVGLSHVPVVLLDVDDDDSLLELALIENVQRTDLNPIEEAEAYRKLIDRFGYTQEQAAKRVGKNRSTVTNLLRLLKLPKEIQSDVINGILTEGHGRSLVRLVDYPLKLQEVRDAIVKGNLSVRQVEKMIKKAISNKPLAKSRKVQEAPVIPASYKKSLITQLTNRLNSKVSISESGNRGKIEIDYYSLDDLDRVTSLLLNE